MRTEQDYADNGAKTGRISASQPSTSNTPKSLGPQWTIKVGSTWAALGADGNDQCMFFSTIKADARLFDLEELPKVLAWCLKTEGVNNLPIVVEYDPTRSAPI